MLLTRSAQIRSARHAGGESIWLMLFHVIHKIFGLHKNSEGIFERQLRKVLYIEPQDKTPHQ